MDYTIKINIPDDLLELMKVLGGSEIRALKNDLGLELRSATKIDHATETATVDPAAMRADIKKEAVRLSKVPELCARAKTLLGSYGYRKTADIPDDKCGEVLLKMREIQ